MGRRESGFGTGSTRHVAHSGYKRNGGIQSPNRAEKTIKINSAQFEPMGIPCACGQLPQHCCVRAFSSSALAHRSVVRGAGGVYAVKGGGATGRP